MYSKFMSCKQILAELEQKTRNVEYDPTYCKTCQRKGLLEPRLARTLYSDCEEHYQRRIRELLLTGVKILRK